MDRRTERRFAKNRVYRYFEGSKDRISSSIKLDFHQKIFSSGTQSYGVHAFLFAYRLLPKPLWILRWRRYFLALSVQWSFFSDFRGTARVVVKFQEGVVTTLYICCTVSLLTSLGGTGFTGSSTFLGCALIMTRWQWWMGINLKNKSKIFVHYLRI